MKNSKSSAVAIFIGLLLVVVFAVGLVCERNPGAFQRKYHYDFALEQFCSFCAAYWLPAGIIGIPTFLISLFVSLAREKKQSSRE